MTNWRWHNPKVALPPPGAMVLAAEVVEDQGFPEGFLYPTIAWMDVDLVWRTRERGVLGGRVIQVERWTHIPPLVEEESFIVERDGQWMAYPIRMAARLMELWNDAER